MHALKPLTFLPDCQMAESGFDNLRSPDVLDGRFTDFLGLIVGVLEPAIGAAIDRYLDEQQGIAVRPHLSGNAAEHALAVAHIAFHCASRSCAASPSRRSSRALV